MGHAVAIAVVEEEVFERGAVGWKSEHVLCWVIVQVAEVGIVERGDVGEAEEGAEHLC